MTLTKSLFPHLGNNGSCPCRDEDRVTCVKAPLQSENRQKNVSCFYQIILFFALLL